MRYILHTAQSHRLRLHVNNCWIDENGQSLSGELAYPGGLDLEDSQLPEEFPPAPMDPPALGGNGASAEQPKAEVSRTALPPSEEAWSLKDSEKPDASEVVKREEAKIDPTKSTGEVPLGEEGKEDGKVACKGVKGSLVKCGII